VFQLKLKVPDAVDLVTKNSTVKLYKTFRNATLENGCVISVPDFVKEGDTVLLDLSSLTYRERKLENH
jgi:hypothetical protein